MDKEKKEGIQQQINDLLQRAAQPSAGNVIGFASTLLAAKMQSLLMQAEIEEQKQNKAKEK
jgi:hypothetical protein